MMSMWLSFCCVLCCSDVLLQFDEIAFAFIVLTMFFCFHLTKTDFIVLSFVYSENLFSYNSLLVKLCRFVQLCCLLHISHRD